MWQGAQFLPLPDRATPDPATVASIEPTNKLILQHPSAFFGILPAVTVIFFGDTSIFVQLHVVSLLPICS